MGSAEFFSRTRPGNTLATKYARMYIRKVPLLTGILEILLLGACWDGNPVSKINRPRYEQIRDKMSKEEVQAILGPPTSMSTEDKIIYKRTIFRYTEGDNYINVTFKNDELDSKDTNLGTK